MIELITLLLVLLKLPCCLSTPLMATFQAAFGLRIKLLVAALLSIDIAIISKSSQDGDTRSNAS